MALSMSFLLQFPSQIRISSFSIVIYFYFYYYFFNSNFIFLFFPFIRYEVRAQDGLTCAGQYIKLIPTSEKNLDFITGQTGYSIMFGPDKCGENGVHLILR